MSQFNSLEFNELRKKWYEELKKGGFEDAEEFKGDYLRYWHSQLFQNKALKTNGFYGPESFQIKSDYFYYASQYAAWAEFQDETEKTIWYLHSEGLSSRSIAEKLGRFGHVKVNKTVQRLRAHFLAFMKVEEGLMGKEDVLKTRPVKESDIKFICNSWWNNLYANVRWVNGFMDRKLFVKYHDILLHILKKPKTETSVCCLKEDEDVIVGYSVVEKTDQDTILHWVFVRNDWQGKGIARDLVPKGITIATHLTKTGEKILEKRQTPPMVINLPRSYEILEAAV